MLIKNKLDLFVHHYCCRHHSRSYELTSNTISSPKMPHNSLIIFDQIMHNLRELVNLKKIKLVLTPKGGKMGTPMVIYVKIIETQTCMIENILGNVIYI